MGGIEPLVPVTPARPANSFSGPDDNLTASAVPAGPAYRYVNADGSLLVLVIPAGPVAPAHDTQPQTFFVPALPAWPAPLLDHVGSLKLNLWVAEILHRLTGYGIEQGVWG
ncbi:hypothetical protein B0T21DRAFT_408899 [Apiosordaria backusii]|uniref:Uncharacterized protein n=1 Tax=Apiosordaria backusii TaxID=314023 RepID=A0AA40EMJ2_9PEZI|nr:hypothetical protein B0T21DRAFT_408899 [Apiosordaria backusii]